MAKTLEQLTLEKAAQLRREVEDYQKQAVLNPPNVWAMQGAQLGLQNMQHRTVITENLAERIDYMERKSTEAIQTARMAHEAAIRVSKFYEWLMLAYPEIISQYKALKDLEAASREHEPGEQAQAYASP